MSRPPRPTPPRPGQESVWDYPRPPRVEPSVEHVVVWFAGQVVADTANALRVLETSHPPVYYLPLDDLTSDLVVPIPRSSWCEFKGTASYGDLVIGEDRSVAACWWYPDPTPAYRALVGHVAFYPGRVDRCLVDGEVVRPQEGGMYGGWITSRIAGPFKGGPGTTGW